MIIISPYSKQLINGKQNPKNYPFWKELLSLIREPVIQVGIESEEKLTYDFRKDLTVIELRELINQCRIWVSCDSFFQHLAWQQKKMGVVLWSVSDPKIFGHPENINLLKDRDNLVQNQFLWWEFVEHKSEYFVSPQEVIKHLNWN